MMNIKVCSLIATVIFLTGCTTYTMTTQHLQDGIPKTKPATSKYSVSTKEGAEIIKEPSQQTSIRITKNDDTRQQFYLVTAYLKDSFVMGSKSAIFNMPIKPIKISEIKKIEVDGR